MPHIVQGVARGHLNHLRHEDVCVASHQVMQGAVLREFATKGVDAQHRDVAIGHLQQRIAAATASLVRNRY